MSEPLLTRYLQPLLAGRRAECFSIVHGAIDSGLSAERLLRELVWPAMTQVERMFRADRISIAVESMAARINRTVADQLQVHLPRVSRRGERIVITCAQYEHEELGAQIVADLFQAQGWDVYLMGAGIPHDEIVSLLGQIRPAAFVIFGARPQDAPDVRALIDRIREIGVCPTMNTVLSGGVFNRAEGLWQEVGADAFAPTAGELIDTVSGLAPRQAGAARRGIIKKRHRRRKSVTVAPRDSGPAVAAVGFQFQPGTVHTAAAATPS